MFRHLSKRKLEIQMETVLKKPQHIISLATAGLLVNVDIHVWTATKQNRDISDEITTTKKASKESGRFIEHLLANDPDHKRVVNYRQTVYNWMKRRTYSWSGAQEYLPQIDLPKFDKEFKNHKLAFEELVEAFTNKYPSIVSNMAFVQGDMFDRSNYPDVNYISSKFSINMYTSEVPLGDHRCAIARDLADDLFENYSKQTSSIIERVMVKQSEQLINVMTSLSHCCGVEETLGKDGETKIKKRKIYDTTVSRALELCDTFKSFNLTNNLALEEARQSLEAALRGVNLEMLRESDAVRENVKDSIDDILSKFRPVIGESF